MYSVSKDIIFAILEYYFRVFSKYVVSTSHVCVCVCIRWCEYLLMGAYVCVCVCLLVCVCLCVSHFTVACLSDGLAIQSQHVEK